MKKISIAALLLSTLIGCGGSESDSEPDSPKNKIPIANAGIDQNIETISIDQNVVSTPVVTLDASSSSDPDGDTLSYLWSLTAVPTNSSASLSNSSSALPTFIADLDGSYVAQLIVNDGIDDSVADTVTIVVARANSIPVANAGIDQNIATTSVVTLDASTSSDPDGDTLSYLWSLTEVPTNSSASLSNSSSASPTFSTDLDGSYVAQLIVNDGVDDSMVDTVTIVAATIKTGVFLDSPVINIGYRTSTLEGVTNSLGEYEYIDGEIVTFLIGEFELPSTIATGTVTPLDLVGTTDITHPTVVNIIRLLQTLDQDGKPSNGLTITDTAKSIAQAVDFELTEEVFEEAVTPLIQNGGQDSFISELVETSDAIAHFQKELNNNFSINMTGKTATSVVTTNEKNCGALKGGFQYTSFTNTVMTRTGSDGFDNEFDCYVEPEETQVFTMKNLDQNYDLPFNCLSYPVCSFNDFNQIRTGTEDEPYTATYTFNPSTNIINYVYVEGSRVVTEIITIKE